MSKNPEQPPIAPEDLEFEGTMPDESEISPEATLDEAQDSNTLPLPEIQSDDPESQEKKALGKIAISKVVSGTKKLGKWLTSPSNPDKARQEEEYFDHILDVAKERAQSELTKDDYPELTLAPQTPYQRRVRKRLEEDTEKLAEAKRHERVIGTKRFETSGRVRKIATHEARRDIKKSAKEQYEKGEITYRELKNAKLKAKRTWVTTGENSAQKTARKRRERVEKAMVRSTTIARGRRSDEPTRSREGQEGYSGTMPIYFRTRSRSREEIAQQHEIENSENSPQPQATQETAKRKKRKRKS